LILVTRNEAVRCWFGAVEIRSKLAFMDGNAALI